MRSTLSFQNEVCGTVLAREALVGAEVVEVQRRHGPRRRHGLVAVPGSFPRAQATTRDGEVSHASGASACFSEERPRAISGATQSTHTQPNADDDIHVP